VIQRESDNVAVEAHIQRVHHGADHRRAESTFVHFRRVRRHHGDGIAFLDAALGQCGAEPFTARIGFSPGVAAFSVNDRRLFRVNGSCAADKTERRQRGVIGLGLI